VVKTDRKEHLRRKGNWIGGPLFRGDKVKVR